MAAKEDPGRSYPFSITVTVGWSKERVRSKLGKPDRESRETVRKELGWGPWPCRLAPGSEYDRWTYRNVAGDTWSLYFVRSTTTGLEEVVEFSVFPTNAIF